MSILSKVAICIASRERPQGLQRLLTGIAALSQKTCELEVIVVDNDPQESARSVCDDFAATSSIALTYAVEPRVGISFARNTCLRLVSANAEFIAFIDDDESPSADWIEQLLEAQRTYGADVVFGPVVPVFPPEAPLWAINAGCFDAPDFATGDSLPTGATNNTLVHRRVVEHFESAFDERFALSGGSDHHFFMRVKKSGFSLIWCDTAVVKEWIPLSRMNLRWILRRSFRTSSHHVLCEKDIHPGISVFLRRSATGVLRLAFGAASLPLTLLFPREIKTSALRQVARGWGLLCGLYGRCQLREYSVVHKA